MSTATAGARRWRLGSASSSSTNWRAFISPSPPAAAVRRISLHCSSAHRTDAVLAGPTSAPEVLKLLTSRPVKSSPVDLLPSVLLRSCTAVFAPIVAHMANLSFVGCRFPAVFKTAQVLHLLKKPGFDKEQMSSYRPISNLVTTSKVIEQLVLDRLRPHLLSSPNYARLQSAYRRGHSAETALLHVMNTVCTAPTARRSLHSSASTSRRPSTPSTTMRSPAVSSRSLVLSALPPSGYGPTSTAVSSSYASADTRLL